MKPNKCRFCDEIPSFDITEQMADYSAGKIICKCGWATPLGIYHDCLTLWNDVMFTPIDINDRALLPEQYSSLAGEPFYKGNGNCSIDELQELCTKFVERCHQQQIIKQNLHLKLINKGLVKNDG